jgi:hypothetical protein
MLLFEKIKQIYPEITIQDISPFVEQLHYKTIVMAKATT